MSLSVLFLGGTGVISSACVREALDAGHQVATLTRGTSTRHPLPDGAEPLTADVRDADAVRAAVGDRSFDAVVDVLSFAPAHVRQALDVLGDRMGQYLFVSSASAYQTPPTTLPVTESTPLSNPLWTYARDKIACEDLLVRAYRDRALPMTIVRPSHTYDRTLPPFQGHWTVVERMREGRPVVVPGDGTSRWTITHHQDFARAFVRLLGHPAALGEAFHITSDEALTWDQIHHQVAAAAGVHADIVHVTSDEICSAEPDLTGSLLGDKAHTMLFDNSKIRTIAPEWRARIPFHEGARQIVEWHDADPARRTVDDDLNLLYDRLVAARRA